MLIVGNASHLPLAAGTVQCCVTSPPYWGLRDYGVPGQLGLERTPDEYVANMVAVFREVWRVLRDDGTLWLNLGDSYCNAGAKNNGVGLDGSRRGGMNGCDGTWADSRDKYGDIRKGFPSLGIKKKDLIGIPWRVAFALQGDGWYLRSDIIWSKGNPMPESVLDRPTRAHEYLFLLTKRQRYFYDHEAICENAVGGPGGAKVPHPETIPAHRPQLADISHHHGGLTRNECRSDIRNRRSVWTVNTQPYPEAHFATFPEKLVEPCILAGTKPGDLVLDPFAGSGTVGAVCRRFARRFVGVELNPAYVGLAVNRLKGQLGMAL